MNFISPCLLYYNGSFGHYCNTYVGKLKFGQMIRSDGPERHLKKKGHYYGGLFIPAIAISLLIFSERTTEIFISVFSMIGFDL